jgi:hypothetical protein
MERKNPDPGSGMNSQDHFSESFGHVGSGSEIFVPDPDLDLSPDLTFFEYNYCKLFVKMVHFVFDYVHISLQNL